MPLLSSLTSYLGKATYCKFIHIFTICRNGGSSHHTAASPPTAASPELSKQPALYSTHSHQPVQRWTTIFRITRLRPTGVKDTFLTWNSFWSVPLSLQSSRQVVSMQASFVHQLISRMHIKSRSRLQPSSAPKFSLATSLNWNILNNHSSDLY